MTNRLNIAQVFDSKYDTPGGVPSYINALDDYFTRQGHDTSLIVGETSVDDPHITSLGRTFPFPLNGNLVDVPYPTPKSQVKGVLQKVDPDIMHIGMTYFPTTGGRFINSVSPDTGVVGTFHVLPYRITSEIGLRIAGARSKSKNRLDHLLTASPVVQDFAKSSFGLESTIVPCPIDVQRFRDGKRLPIYDDDRVNIMFLGRLDDRKGAGHLIDAVAQLDAKTLAETRIVIGGKGKLEPKLHKQVATLGLEGVVEFSGRVEEADKANFLASADVVTLPAMSGESFGIMVAEAMAAGGVVVGGDNPGYRSILSKRTPELLVNARKHAEFAEVLRNLIVSGSYRREQREKQQENIDEYDISVVGAQILDIYHDVLSRRRGA